ncbi:hypothetical protein [Nonomuraea gerenzanensis]|uniref:Secreted protein n=1 Tax=Nonomuraea gerenzanensis TaxID=93944 RepID=A0A1M4EMD5_9ACTN|nr:hypothetical protein [Nonomuraea gerenzanensis]UBU11491.1 hypothetical protein LCN96_45440 [Nonomuraea gerenzanensis]SBO99978.1 hypothetical protein BN4615_P9494 [Nonomuraea gerenzanensis]
MKNSTRLLLTVAASAALVAGSAFTISAATAQNASARAAAGTTFWAKVAANGNLLAASGIGNVNKFGQGRYNLRTNADISRCALTGTINTNGGSDPGPGSASILVGAVDGRTLFVRTATPSGPSPRSVDDDRPFSLLLAC